MFKINSFKRLGGKSLMCGAAMLVLSACATSTPTQTTPDQVVANIYYQAGIDENTGRVSYEGNLFKDPKVLEGYLVYRAAEIAVEGGFDHFTIKTPDIADDISGGRHKAKTPLGFKTDAPLFLYSFYQPDLGWTRSARLSTFLNSINGCASTLTTVCTLGGFSNAGNGTHVVIKTADITKSRAFTEVEFIEGDISGRDAASYNARDVLDKNNQKFSYINTKTVSSKAEALDTGI